MNEVEHRLERTQRLASPVDRDLTKEPIFNRIVAGVARGIVTNHNLQAKLISPLLLDFLFPEPVPTVVGAPRITQDQDHIFPPEARPIRISPPLSDTMSGKFGRMVRSPDIDIALIVGQIIEAIRDSQALCVTAKIMGMHFVRFLPPGAPFIVKSANQLLPPSAAFELSQRFELHYTPIKGSWLNMAEIEFAALVKQCLDRRIPDFETLQREVLAWADQRNLDRKSVNWAFSQSDARHKLKRHYRNIQKFT